MFNYTICTVADEELFYRQCRALERGVPDLQVLKLLVDVDGTLVQRYRHPRGEIIVRNDIPVDALYITSDFDLEPYFRKD